MKVKIRRKVLYSGIDSEVYTDVYPEDVSDEELNNDARTFALEEVEYSYHPLIEEIHGNIFDIDADVIVNPVNTVGVMGGGLALQFKNRFPKMFEHYKAKCKDGSLKIGSIDWFCKEVNQNTGNEKYIVNLPTKEHWKDPSKIEYIEKGIDALIELLLKDEYIKTVAIPKLGCGLGGLDWNDVKKIIIKKFEDVEEFDERDIAIYLVV